MHNPSAHHMAGWPLLLPPDPHNVVLDRLCPHDVAHPDPDAVRLADDLDQTHVGEHQLHTCDGCCRPPA